jgi:hypothetical protein
MPRSEQAVRMFFDRGLPPRTARPLRQLVAQRGHEELHHRRVRLEAVQPDLAVEGRGEPRRELNPHLLILDGHRASIALSPMR